MRTISGLLLVVAAGMLPLTVSCQEKKITSVTVPVILDHNRMLVDAEIQGKDGGWRRVRLWIDTGNPSFYMSEALARDLGIDLPSSGENMNIAPPTGVRINGMQLSFEDVRSRVMIEPHWLFSTMHNDGNLPSTVLMKYHVVFDYPGRRLTIAERGILQPRGIRTDASIHPDTGVPQINAVVDGDSMAFALDNGAAYSFASYEVVESLRRKHPAWPNIVGTTGCANMWGWWPPNEETLPVLRVPEIVLGSVRLNDVAIVGVPAVSENGPSLGAWYSQKTAFPVVGFLGPNAFGSCRVEIDYANSVIYLEKGDGYDSHDMDLVGLTLRPEPDTSYSVIGVAMRNGAPVVEGVEPGDVLLRVDELETTGATFGTVMDALRGKPGETRILELERDGRVFTIEATVMRVL